MELDLIIIKPKWNLFNPIFISDNIETRLYGHIALDLFLLVDTNCARSLWTIMLKSNFGTLPTDMWLNCYLALRLTFCYLKRNPQQSMLKLLHLAFQTDCVIELSLNVYVLDIYCQGLHDYLGIFMLIPWNIYLLCLYLAQETKNLSLFATSVNLSAVATSGRYRACTYFWYICHTLYFAYFDFPTMCCI
jgi:hypothetical protein